MEGSDCREEFSSHWCQIPIDICIYIYIYTYIYIWLFSCILWVVYGWISPEILHFLIKNVQLSAPWFIISGVSYRGLLNLWLTSMSLSWRGGSTLRTSLASVTIAGVLCLISREDRLRDTRDMNIVPPSILFQILVILPQFLYLFDLGSLWGQSIQEVLVPKSYYFLRDWLRLVHHLGPPQGRTWREHPLHWSGWLSFSGAAF